MGGGRRAALCRCRYPDSGLLRMQIWMDMPLILLGVCGVICCRDGSFHMDIHMGVEEDERKQ